MAQLLKTLVIAAVVFYVVSIAVMYFAQRRFIYFPDPTRTLPHAAGLANVLEQIIATPDGEKIVAWYGKAAPGQPTLLYFHGNGGALELRAERIAKYLDRGRGLFMMSYRGYSGSTGSPSEAGNIADAKLAYDALIEGGVSPDDIILYGESLGTGVAIEVAAEKKVAGVILDSPFTSIIERAGQLYPWLPVSLLLQDRYDSIRRIRDVHVPIFILHGEADDVVPVEMGRQLFQAANEPKEIKTLAGAGHADHYNFGSFEIINRWIDRLRAAQASLRN
jgi:fermentation-respiration switch protein FrsA (DUF1100 family)